MAVIFMPPINTLVSNLRGAYPQLTFTHGTPCRWSPGAATIFFEPIQTQEDAAVLLHEVAHAVLQHNSYRRDIELLDKERAAWQLARTTLANTFGVTIDPDLIDAHLDTYRSWLHERSLCPTCRQTGLQTKTKTYSCVNCRSLWRVNDGRQCQQRRWKTAT